MDLAAMESIAVDLASPRSIDRAKRRRGRKQAISPNVLRRIETEIQRAERRIDWLDRKESRLPVGSNGRHKTVIEAIVLRSLVNDLQKPPKSRPKGTAYSSLAFKHAARAAALLNEIVPEKGNPPKPEPVRPSPMVGETREPRTWHGPRLAKPNARKRTRRAAAQARKANR